ncbi:MAG: formamidopyrimidine-DNA glycosylase [Deltaproteobacteria bacterium]|nr:formamidopyrimidine-DNA glycosylase [Deltaproteobacteria bacterium]
MPEIPDVVVYLERIEAKTRGATLEAMRFASPFVLRSFDPKPAELAGRRVVGYRRIGKRLVLGVEGDLFVVIHLMIAGRLRWSDAARDKIPGKVGLAAFDFASASTPTGSGTLVLTEASTKKRASVHLVRGEAALADFDRGGVEPLAIDRAAFAAALRRENHTLKRTLTDPRLFSGIGNAYSDEILHRAKLSPVALSQKLDEAQIDRLYAATRETLVSWTDALRAEALASKLQWPDKVTAFREEMAVHGKYGKPCPVCGAPVQRIAYAENETNYCATCQTGGKLLADRSLSRLLKDDWPKTIEELEERKSTRGPA